MKKPTLLLLGLPLVLMACERPLVDGEAEVHASLGSYEQVEGITEVAVYEQAEVDTDEPMLIEWYEATLPLEDDVSMVLLGVRGGLDHPALDDGRWRYGDPEGDFRAYLIGCVGPEYGVWDVDLNAPADLEVVRRDDGRLDVVAQAEFQDQGRAALTLAGVR